MARKIGKTFLHHTFDNTTKCADISMPYNIVQDTAISQIHVFLMDISTYRIPAKLY